MEHRDRESEIKLEFEEVVRRREEVAEKDCTEVGLAENSKSAVETKVENNTVKYGGKINGNDCKLSVNY